MYIYLPLILYLNKHTGLVYQVTNVLGKYICSFCTWSVCFECICIYMYILCVCVFVYMRPFTVFSVHVYLHVHVHVYLNKYKIEKKVGMEYEKAYKQG